MQVLLDKMKHDPDWEATSESFDPLTLTRLTEKTTLAQTADQCPFPTAHEQEQPLHSFRQQGLSNEQWHEKFNTKSTLGKLSVQPDSTRHCCSTWHPRMIQ